MEFSRPFTVEELRDERTRRSIEAGAAERIALAARLDLPAINALSADLEIAHRRGPGETESSASGLTVTGRLRAEVRQVCVVSLEEFDGPVEEEFQIDFTPDAFDGAAGEDEIEVDLAEEDLPEPFDGEAIDLGEIVAQQLALALDPHPRRPGVDPVGGKSAGPGAGEEGSPFAVLRQLKAGDA